MISFRKPKEDRVRRLAASRLRQVPTGEVLAWAETGVNDFHRTLDEYRGRRETAILEDLRKTVSMLAGAVDVLENRNQS